MDVPWCAGFFVPQPANYVSLGKAMNKKEEQEFESLLDIDRHRLDDESEEQPRKVWIYGKMLAKALLDLDEASSNLKLTEADVDAAVREDPSDYGLEKITEPAVKKAILRSKEYQKAVDLLNNAQYRVHVVEAANKALDHRRTSLTMLNSQDERNYFSRPREKERTDTGKSRHRRPLKRNGR